MRRTAVLMAGAVLIAAMLATPAAAKGRPTTVEYGNNLSQPAIFVVGDGVDVIPSEAPQPRVACDGTPQAPGLDGALAVDGYWLQKTDATWGGFCDVASSAVVALDWGDNLIGDTALKAGKTIRVEVGLDQVGPGALGYAIQNLSEEGVPDRLAVYGTDDTVGSVMDVKVWDHDATFMIETVVDGVVVDAFTVDATAEINSMGAIVYGYNWGQKGTFPAAGDYRITFTTSDDTTIASVVDWNPDTMDRQDHMVSLDLTLTPRSGGGRVR